MNPTSIRVALYARVSTAKCEKCGKIRIEHDNHDHDFKGQDPEVQLRELREYVERRGWQVADVYTDVGVSGAKASRPELNRSMIDAGRRRFDAVVVWRFDRFARSVSHLLRVLEQFQAIGIDFISLLGECRHQHAYWQDGLHGSRSRCRTGAQPDCGKSKGRSAQCTRERKEAGSSPGQGR